MYKKAYVAGGCFWGESVRGTDARLIESFYELLRNKRSNEWTAPVRSKKVNSCAYD